MSTLWVKTLSPLPAGAATTPLAALLVSAGTTAGLLGGKSLAGRVVPTLPAPAQILLNALARCSGCSEVCPDRQT